MPKDYYNVLGVSRDVGPDEIKRAYRKLALQHHPDRPNGNEEKFKEINEAYQVLSDPQKRQQYDQFGQTFEGRPFAGAQGGPFGAGFDPFVVFQREFSGFEDLFGDLFGVRSARRTRVAEQGDDRATAVTITFEEMVRGTKRAIALERLRTCPKCAGSGTEPGTKIVTCATCQGAGAVERQLRSFFGTMLHRATCPDCGGEGKRPEKLCRACSGTGRTHQRETLAVKIPPGLEDGMRLRLTGEGEAGPRGGPAGDLYVTVRVQKHPALRREGDHLRSTVAVPFTTAALGGAWTIETIDGPVELHVPRGTASGTEVRIPEKGIVRGRHGQAPSTGSGQAGKRGDHIVTVVIDVPKRLTKEQEDLLRKFTESGSRRHRIF